MIDTTQSEHYQRGVADASHQPCALALDLLLAEKARVVDLAHKDNAAATARLHYLDGFLSIAWPQGRDGDVASIPPQKGEQ